MTTAAPGWYPDPSGDARILRYWDGAQWTEGTMPVQPGAAPGAGVGQPANAGTPGAVYAVSSSDATLRLVAFVFMLLATIGLGILIIPLTWMIPMTIHCWGVYKGKKANTVAFGVCTLIFCAIIPGILLLVSTKEG